MPRAPWIAVLVALGSTPLAAQLCAGLPSFQGRPVQLVGAALFNDDGRAFRGGVGFGGAGAFGSLELGTQHFDAFNASGFIVGGGAGYQVSLEKRSTLQLCPDASVQFAIGPKNISGTGSDYSATVFELGVVVGAALAATERIDIVSVAGIDFVSATARLKDASGNSISQSQSFGAGELGLGFVFNHHTSIRPAVAFPFGSNSVSTTFTVTVAVNFGVAH